MTTDRFIRRIVVLILVTVSVGVMPLLGQEPCYTVSVNCTTCNVGLCWNCGWNDALQIFPDYAIYCYFQGNYCYYCWNGCSYPYDMCQSVRTTGVHRCNEGDPFYDFYTYWCCNYCGY